MSQQMTCLHFLLLLVLRGELWPPLLGPRKASHFTLRFHLKIPQPGVQSKSCHDSSNNGPRHTSIITKLCHSLNWVSSNCPTDSAACTNGDGTCRTYRSRYWCEVPSGLPFDPEILHLVQFRVKDVSNVIIVDMRKAACS